jgi:NodT family efflux transporter outer membrane factor (OMF) lipoprotein
MALMLAVPAGGCAFGPDYFPPPAPVPAAYKEIKGWKIAEARDVADRGAWWSVFHDDILDGLERQVEISNQNLAAAEAAFRQSVALVQQGRAALFPVIGVDYSAIRSHEGAAVTGSGIADTKTTVTLETTGTWDLDVWGRIRRTIESDAANAQASAADLANARLSAQAQLAAAYFNLRAADSLQRILDTSVANFKRTQEITENQYAQGTVARSDVVTAQTQVRTTEAQAINVGIQRAQFEHAIAVLIGVPPAALAIKHKPLATRVPSIPPSVPSLLLERRPDIAAAERRIQAQSALIGVAVAAYFPDVSISGFFGWVGTRAFPISVANEVWSVGGALAETVFDGGLRRAQVVAAEAAYYQSVANYRQTVLTAFQQVEDQLAAQRILAKQARVQDDAVKLSRQAVEITLNEYKAGTVSFTTVVTAQATQLSNEQAALAVRQSRFLAGASLITALGGGWDWAELPGYEELRHWRSCVSIRGAIRGDVGPEMPACL